MKKIVLFTLIIFFYCCPNAMPLEFDVKTETAVVGRDSELGASFSSVLTKDSTVMVEMESNDKFFQSKVPLKGIGTFKGINIKDESTASLDEYDIERLMVLQDSLDIHLDNNILVQKKLNQLISFLVRFPINEELPNYSEKDISEALQLKDELQSFLEMNKVKTKYSSICDNIGQPKKGKFFITELWSGDYNCGDYATTEWKGLTQICTLSDIVGPCDKNPCLGRCGPTCGHFTDPVSHHLFSLVSPGKKHSYIAFTQECFNHDLCAKITGEIFGPCMTNFLWAIDGYLNAPDCSNCPDPTLIPGATNICGARYAEIMLIRFSDKHYAIEAYIDDPHHLVRGAFIQGQYGTNFFLQLD